MSHGYLHFRCKAHEVDGSYAQGNEATYRCSAKGCERPAKAYWYRGPDFQHLKVPSTLTINYGSGVDGLYG